MNNIRSQAYKTDLIFSGFEGYVENKENYLVIKTPSRPNYFWGNYLLFKQMPQQNSYKEWLEIYKMEFGNPNPTFITFGLDSVNKSVSNLEEFLNNGFLLQSTSVLASTRLIKPKRFNSDIEVRELNNNDWDGWIEVHKNENWYLSEKSETQFLKTELISCKNMTEAGLGKRFGAFLDGRLVGELGIYFNVNLGRFNKVSTHRNYRNMGICQTLLFEGSKYVIENCKIEKLLIVADNQYYAVDIYKKAGFIECETQLGLEWYDKNIF